MINIYISNFQYQMIKIDEGAIQKELQRLNIPYDMQIIKEVHLFLSKFIGPMSTQDSLYHIPAACAIICQTIKIPTIGSRTLTSTGIKIENVMRHIGNLSKQKFLETIQTQIKKSNFSNHSLTEKVSKIKISFRVFKKYKTIFENLGLNNKIPYSINQEILAFFWIVFLIAKANLQSVDDLTLSTKILLIIIQQVFCNYYGRESRQNVRQYFCQKDNFAELTRPSSLQQQMIKKLVYDLIDKALKNRDPTASPNSNHLMENQIFLSRIVDDLNTEYDKLYQQLPYGRFIDEMTFLELTKNLTPQAFVFKAKQEPISKILSFDDEQDQQQNQQYMKDSFKTQGKKPVFLDLEDSSQKTLNANLFSSPTFNQNIETRQFRLKSTKPPVVDLTPVSLGHSKSAWAQKYIQKFDSEKQAFIKNYFTLHSIDHDRVVEQCKQKIQSQIQTLTPYITNKQKTVNQILKMTFQLAFQFLSVPQQQLQIRKQQIFDGLLCISTFLYNSATRYLSLDLQKYCSCYGAKIQDCLKIMYQMLEHFQFPLIIKQMLSQLQKQVLIKELWDTNAGFQILEKGKIKQNQIIWNRLERRIFQRIKQICVAIKVDLSEVQKIQALVKEILTKKYNILMKNKLDQIIICSISACLSLNEAKYNLALSTIFQKYNSISLSLHSNREITNNNRQQQGQPQTLLQFYNKVFIHEVQEMMSKEQNPKYLYTPIRQNHLRKLKDESDFKFSHSNSMVFGGKDGKSISGNQTETNSYQKQILQKMKEKQRADSDQNSSQNNSPCFGTGSIRLDFSFDLKRKFTFGPSNNNNGNNES